VDVHASRPWLPSERARDRRTGQGDGEHGCGARARRRLAPARRAQGPGDRDDERRGGHDPRDVGEAEGRGAAPGAGRARRRRHRARRADGRDARPEGRRRVGRDLRTTRASALLGRRARARARCRALLEELFARAVRRRSGSVRASRLFDARRGHRVRDRHASTRSRKTRSPRLSSPWAWGGSR
jgi:hypothetical protein